jgi:signal transduction histidine kinase
MSLVTVLWSMIGAAALTLGIVQAMAWLLDRRNLPSLMLSLICVALACYARFDLGLMYASTPAEYGQWLRWYYLPAFIFYVGCVLLVRSYLGTGRPWLAWTIIGTRFLTVVANFLVDPNVTWYSISSLRRVSFLGEPVAVIDHGVLRPLQWFLSVPTFLLLAFVIDAALERWHRGGTDSKAKALVVSLGIAGPVAIAWVVWQVGVLRLGGFPMLYTPLFALTLVVMGFELSRAANLNRRSQLEIAGLRADLVRAGRVSALGQLASGLAHELCQPLDAILHNTQAAELQLKRGKPDLEELRSILKDIREDDTRAGKIISRMRALIERRSIEMNPLMLSDLVDDVISLAHSEALSKRVALNGVVEPDLPRVLGDRVQISQVLLNLVMNGIEAVQTCPASARCVTIEARTTGERAEIAVRDSGPGLPPGNLNQVFEPFYSTKADGMGMGLAICRAIVEGHEGHIWAERSESEPGATFRFTLPLAHERGPSTVPPPAASLRVDVRPAEQR